MGDGKFDVRESTDNAKDADIQIPANVSPGQLLNFLGSQGIRTPEQFANVIRSHPSSANAIVYALQKTRGNGFVQAVIHLGANSSSASDSTVPAGTPHPAARSHKQVPDTGPDSATATSGELESNNNGLPPRQDSSQQHLTAITAPATLEVTNEPGATTAVAASPSTSSHVQNMHYADALHYVEEYFRRQGEIANLVGQAAEAGFRAFTTYSSEEYNRTSSIAAQLFEVALALAPGGAAVIGTLKAMQTGEQLEKLAKALEQAKGTTEKIEAVKTVRDKGKDTGEKQEASSEARERGDFQVETTNSLLEFALSNLQSRWDREDVINAELHGYEFTPTVIDVEQLVQKALGPLPTSAGLDNLRNTVRDEFEYKLYLDYYVSSGKAIQVMESINTGLNIKDTEGPIENLPEKVKQRIKQMGRWDQFVFWLELEGTIQQQPLGGALANHRH